MTEPTEERTAETIKEKFPDAGEPPTDDVVVDPEAEESPNIGHPE